MAQLMLLLCAAQRASLVGARSADVCAGRTNDPQCNDLLFPGDGGSPQDDNGPEDDASAWRKGKLTLGGDYWWRETGDGEPEISLTDPTEQWKVGMLEDTGREYFWRARDGDEDDLEVRLARYDGEDPSEADADGVMSWKIGTLPSGREYLWRENDADPDDPEVQWWTESTLDNGNPFWYDEDGEVTLKDPFERWRVA